MTAAFDVCNDTPPLPTYALSQNVPYLFDFFLEVDGLTHARPGRFGLDAYLVPGGVTLFVGRVMLQIDVHAIRALLRWKRSEPLQPTPSAL